MKTVHQENGILLIYTFAALFHLNILCHLDILLIEIFQAHLHIAKCIQVILKTLSKFKLAQRKTDLF
jgi:hypothetical protein